MARDRTGDPRPAVARRSGVSPVALVVSAVLLAGLVACGGGRATSAATGTPAAAPPVMARDGLLVDVAAQSGLDFTHGAFRWGTSADPAAMMGGGACWLDADDDGWMDLYLVNTWTEAEHPRWVAEGRLPTSTLYRNEGGTFRDVGGAAGAELAVRGQGCLAADLDGDGATDLYITTARSNVLLWNDGDGTFTPDGGVAGLDVYGWHTTASAADVDGDGRLDVFVGGYVDVNTRLDGASGGFPRTHAPVRDLLLRNAGPGDGARARFVAVDPGAGLDPDGPRYTLGSLFTDADGDGDVDLVVADDTDPNRLYRNDSTPGRVRLTDIAEAAGADDDNSGMGVAAGDLDGDGRLDLVVTNMGAQRHTMLGSPGGPGLRYSDLREQLGVVGLGEGLTGWGVTPVDLDLDGDTDLVVANGAIPVTDLAGDAQPVLTYESSGGRLGPSPAGWGSGGLPVVNGRGSAVADYDNDGDPDLVVVSVGGAVSLLRNTLDAQAAGVHWLVVDPEGRRPGTRVVAELPSGRVLVRELQAGSSYLSSEDPRLLLGLGTADRVDRLTVVWPDGTRTVRTDVVADQKVFVPAESGGVTPLVRLLRAPTRAWWPAGPAAGLLRVGGPAGGSGAVGSGAGGSGAGGSGAGGSGAGGSGAVGSMSAAGECGEGSTASRWIEATLSVIRRDLPAPTVHARNLFHISAAMWDAWAAYDPAIDGLYADVSADAGPTDQQREAARSDAVARAAHDVAVARYADSHDGEAAVAELDDLLEACGPRDPDADQVGARVAATVLGDTAGDGAARGEVRATPPVNDPLVVSRSGAEMVDPDRWQPLQLEEMVSQNGIPQQGAVQSQVGARWGWVRGFALPAARNGVAVDPGPPPRTTDPDGGAALRRELVEVLRASAQLDPRDGVLVDVSPASTGGSTLGADDDRGHARNPVTGEAYEPSVVARADVQRVLAEFWADGPTSETPPGHWNNIAGQVSATVPAEERRIGGTGPLVDRLEWDVKLYVALNGALHDAAVAAWGVKARYDSARPISLIRHLGSLGQSSDPDGPAFDPAGLPLVEGLVAVVTEDSSAPGGPHTGLADHVGEVAVRTWTPAVAAVGDPSDRVRWVLAADWVPYQRSTFVTPAFPGYVSGHSTFSRAAAELLTAFTGSPWFPGGLATWTVPAGGLVFEDGPTTDITLQWASYADAADQAGRSRIYGGIHIPSDDLAGRRLGAEVGRRAWDRAHDLFGGVPS